MTHPASLTIFDSTDDGPTCSHCGQLLPTLSDPTASELGPFARDSKTSRQAALDTYPRQGSQRERILSSLAEAPATRDELVIRLRLRGNTVRPRVRELIQGGWVVETEQTRKTATGSEASVLRITGRAATEMGLAA